MKALGVDISKLPPETFKRADFEVEEENWDTVIMFLNMQTQWNIAYGGYVGLKYEVLLLKGGLFDLFKVEDRSKVLYGLQIMESTALKIINKEKK